MNQSDITILSQTNPAPANGSSNPLPTYGAPNVTFTPRTSDPLGAWTYEGSAPNTPGFIGVDHVTYRYCETAPVPEVTIPHQDACSTPGGGVTGSIGYTVTNDAISTSGWDPAPTFQEGQASTFNFLAEVNPYDPGALADTVSAPTLPAGWTATGSGADYTITPPKGFVGTATFTYTITDDTCSEAGGQTARGTCSVGSGVQGDFNNETKSVSVTATVNEASAT